MQLEATGKSVEIAIQNGLLECGMKREDVEVKVVDQGGLFKKAKVILIWGEEKEVVEETTQDEVEIESTDSETIEEISAPVEKKKRIVDTTRIQQKGTEFLLGLAKMVDPDATVECIANENEVSFAVKGEKLGKLIGYHGENIQALQMLVSALKTRGEGAIRTYLDIAGYKASRNQTVIDF